MDVALFRRMQSVDTTLAARTAFGPRPNEGRRIFRSWDWSDPGKVPSTWLDRMG